jgi:hypothetical protein
VAAKAPDACTGVSRRCGKPASSGDRGSAAGAGPCGERTSLAVDGEVGHEDESTEDTVRSVREFERWMGLGMAVWTMDAAHAAGHRAGRRAQAR